MPRNDPHSTSCHLLQHFRQWKHLLLIITGVMRKKFFFPLQFCKNTQLSIQLKNHLILLPKLIEVMSSQTCRLLTKHIYFRNSHFALSYCPRKRSYFLHVFTFFFFGPHKSLIPSLNLDNFLSLNEACRSTLELLRKWGQLIALTLKGLLLIGRLIIRYKPK